MFIEVVNCGVKGASRVFHSVGVIFVLTVLALLSMGFSASHTASQLFVLLILALGCLLLLGFSLAFYRWRFFEGRGECSTWAHSVLLRAFVALVAGAFLEASTVFGSPLGHVFTLSDWSLGRLLFFCVLSYAVVVLIDYVAIAKRGGLATLKNKNYRVVLAKKLGLCAGVPVVLSLIAVSANSSFLSLAVVPVSLVVLVFAVWHLQLHSKVEWIFLGVALTFGAFLSLLLPITSGISWDDQIHYSNALDASYVLTSQHTETDIRFAEEAPRRTLGQDIVSLGGWLDESHSDHRLELNESYDWDMSVGNAVSDETAQALFSLNTFGYIPSAIGLWIARLFQFDFADMVLVGRFFNMLAYVAAFFAAIKVVPHKKVLFAVVGLFPTSLFLSASYSYDSWLIAMTALGFAFFLRATWNEELRFRSGDYMLALLFLLAGLFVKAVYFPVLGLLFIVPRGLFKIRKHRRIYQASVLLAGLLLLASFAIPFLLSASTATGDARGGSDVNSAEQLRFVLQNPLQYFSILLNFLFSDYFNPVNANSYLVNYAYLGNLYYCLDWRWAQLCVNYLPLALLLGVALTCGDTFTNRMVSAHWTIWAALIFVCSFALVATGLYVSFTPVGLDTVNGCQYRYIIPWLLPGAFFVFNCPFKSLSSRPFYGCGAVSLSALILFACTGWICFPQLI